MASATKTGVAMFRDKTIKIGVAEANRNIRYVAAPFLKFMSSIKWSDAAVFVPEPLFKDLLNKHQSTRQANCIPAHMMLAHAIKAS